jgi:hypothetical protein
MKSRATVSIQAIVAFVFPIIRPFEEALPNHCTHAVLVMLCR